MHRRGAEAAEDGERIAQARRWMQERKGHAFLVVAEMVEVVHDCAAQMAEHEPEDGQEDFLGVGDMRKEYPGWEWGQE